MRRIIFIILSLTIAALLCACADKSTNPVPETTSSTLPIIQPSDETTQPAEETTPLSLSKHETQIIFREMYTDTIALLDDIISATNYWNDTDFTSIEQIRHLESMWADMADKAQEMVDVLNDNIPASEYEQLWNDYKDIMVDVPSLFANCCDLDPNKDGHYTDEEILPLIRETKDDVVAKLDEAGRITMNVPIPSQVSPPQQLELCIVCEKNASRTYTNPFSGEEETYCETHYQEIIDTMGEMASDVATSSVRHTDSEAWTCAKKIVKDSLKSPSSAKFCSISEITITHLGNGKYKVTGWVEAQNSYGAAVREYFVVTYTALSSGYKNASVTFD